MLDVRTASVAIEEFNRGSSYPYADAVVQTAFAQSSASLSHYARVVLLDSLFFTNMARSRPSGAEGRKSLFTISEGIRLVLGDVDRKLAAVGLLDSLAPEGGSESARSTVVEILELMMSQCNNKALSFVAKYLHFLRPRVFAPWDKYVPMQVGRTLPQANIDSGPNTRRYVKLLDAYRTVWANFDRVERDSLIELDFATQPSICRTRNTPIRLLDKVFWLLGKKQEERPGRVK